MKQRKSKAALEARQQDTSHHWHVGRRQNFFEGVHSDGDSRLAQFLQQRRAQANNSPVALFSPPHRPQTTPNRKRPDWSSPKPVSMEHYSTETSFPSGAALRWARLKELREAEASAQEQGFELQEVDPALAEELEQMQEGSPRSPQQLQDQAAEAFHPGPGKSPEIVRPHTAGALKSRRSFSNWTHHGMRFRVVGNGIDKEDDDDHVTNQLRVFPPRKGLSTPEQLTAGSILLFGTEASA